MLERLLGSRMTDCAGLAEPRRRCKSCCCLCVPWDAAGFSQRGRQEFRTQSCMEEAHGKKPTPLV